MAAGLFPRPIRTRRGEAPVDKASLIGLLVMVVCLGFVAVEVSHGNFGMFWSLEGVLMVGGGSISVTFMAMPMDKMMKVPGYLKRFLFHKGMAAEQVVKIMGEMSEK